MSKNFSFKAKKILVVSTKAPFPSRDGVTVPITSYVKGLRALGHELDLLILDDLMNGGSFHEDNDLNFVNIESLKVSRFRGVDLLKFIFKKRYPYFAALKIPREAYCESFDRSYDWIWVSPRRALGPVLQLKANGHWPDAKIIGAVNDIESLRLEKMSSQRLKELSSPLKSLILKLKARVLRPLEINLLNGCRVIQVQTTAEQRWIEAHANELIGRTIVLSNGVDEKFFSVSLERNQPSLVFVGAIDGMYAERVVWFINRVWPRLRECCSQAKMTVIGRVKDEDMVAFFQENAVEYIHFVDCPEDLYSRYSILVAPIFKGYGLINKVLQSMAAGTLVVGDRSAFNGIEGFVDGMHGLIAETEIDFIEQIVRVCESETYELGLRTQARMLVEETFGWNKRITEISGML